MAYLPKLNPTVGNGLGGLPERKAGYVISDIHIADKAISNKWVLANGDIVLQSKYPDLFKVIGINNNINIAKIANPSTLPTGDGLGASWSSDGVYLAIAHNTSPYVSVYKSALLFDPSTQFQIPLIGSTIAARIKAL